MTLTEIEKQSALWKRITDELGRRLATLRQKNDGMLDETETARLRGNIAVIKEILAWEETPRPNI